MGQVVLGLGTSHSPQLNVPVDRWSLITQKDEKDTRFDYAELVKKARPEIKEEISPDVVQKKIKACMNALLLLRRKLRETPLDALFVIGDDQHENFHADNMPAYCIYQGESVEVVKKSSYRAEWQAVEGEGNPVGIYPCHPRLAEHTIKYLMCNGFDVACSNRLKSDVGLGHAFSFIYRHILPEADIPIVPVMLNTFYPPNRPIAARCYGLGSALRDAIEQWTGPERVAVIASGGLSHVIIDEELDRMTIQALLEKDKDYLCSLSDEKIFPPGSPGTSEISNWVAAAGCLEHLNMTLVGYFPVYRSPAGTGCGMTFAYWN